MAGPETGMPPFVSNGNEMDGNMQANNSKAQAAAKTALNRVSSGMARAVIQNDMDSENSRYSVASMQTELAKVSAASAAAAGPGGAASAAELDEEEFTPPKAPKTYKIAMFAWESLHAVAVGGVAPHLTELSAGLARRGHEVHAYVRTGGGQKQYELIDGVHIHRIGFDLCSDFVQECTNMCNAMVEEMKRTEGFMAATFDICHAHDWLAAQAVTRIKRELNRKCVFTCHSTEYGRCGNNNYGGVSEKIRGIEQDGINCGDRVIGVSGVLCDEVKSQFSFDWNKLRCVYNGINCFPYDGLLWDPAGVRGQYGVGPMDPMVLFVGRLATQKGPDILIEAIPHILANRPDAKFVIVGDGYMKDELERRTHDLGCAGSVKFLGSMKGQALVDLFKATDVVAIPSRNEPFGIVTLEAWAASKPVVVTKSGGPREFVWHDNDGFLVDTEPGGMSWGICQIFANFKHSQYMGERGRVKAAFQFSWDRIAEVTNNVYDELFGIFPPREPEKKPS
mmetsp:Transcript_10227/g.21451  ORF Transcript_10227/g.21451 Transcript_10227/m.21451 type:complete len:507 (+) Transcript_10227:221-1741(+)